MTQCYTTSRILERILLNPRSDQKRNNILRTFDRIPISFPFSFSLEISIISFARIQNLILFAYEKPGCRRCSTLLSSLNNKTYHRVNRRLFKPTLRDLSLFGERILHAPRLPSPRPFPSRFRSGWISSSRNPVTRGSATLRKRLENHLSPAC